MKLRFYISIAFSIIAAISFALFMTFASIAAYQNKGPIAMAATICIGVFFVAVAIVVTINENRNKL